VRAAVEKAKTDFDAEFDAFNFSRAIEAVWLAIARVDKFISDAKPWDLAKSPSSRGDLDLVLDVATNALRSITVLLAPVLPESSQEIWEQLGEKGKVGEVNPQSYHWNGANRRIGNVRGVFPRLDKEKIMEEINQAIPSAPEESTKAAATTSEPVAGIVHIGIEDFAKVELKAGEILTADRVPKADKLLKFTVDVGETSPRQILAGIAQYYEPEKLIGRKVIVVTNLAPRKLRGMDSQGMILAAAIGEEGRPVLAGFLEDVPNGAKLR
jgi:methionyl-tRNA synthetase